MIFEEGLESLAKQGVIINGGLVPMSEDVFRVGSMGYVYKEDVEVFLEALGMIK